jgi:hypothetical protein
MKSSRLFNGGVFASLRISAVLLAVCLFCATGAFAQTNTAWLFNNGNGNWSNSANWTNGVPNGNYNATIDTLNSAQVALDINATVVNLSLGPSVLQNDGLGIDPGKTLTVTNSFIAADPLALGSGSVLNVNGNLSVEAGCSDCPASIDASRSTINVGSSFAVTDVFGATFDGTKVQVGGNFTRTGNGSPVYIQGGSTFTVFGNFSNNGESLINVTGGSTVTIYGTFTTGAVAEAPTVLLIDSTSALTTYSGYYQTLGPVQVNGVLNAGGAGVNLQGNPSSTSLSVSGTINGNVTMQGGSLSNTGTINGNINAAGGILSGTGTINGNVTMGGTISPGDAPGTLTINGNCGQTGNGVFDEMLGSGSNGLLDVNGVATLDPGAYLDVMVAKGFNPLGDRFTIMDYDSLSGVFADGSTFSADGYNWDLSYAPNDIVLTAVTATPEPATLPLLALGILALCGYVWRKRATGATLRQL